MIQKTLFFVPNIYKIQALQVSDKWSEFSQENRKAKLTFTVVNDLRNIILQDENHNNQYFLLFQISLVGNKAILELKRISETEAGDYIITIRNPIGAAQSQAKLKIQIR